jgi:hypothetical protein
MIEGTSVNRIDMERLKGGFSLDPKHRHRLWQKKVEFELTISNLWTPDEVWGKYSRE